MSDPTDPGGVAKRPARARSARVGDTGSPLATPVTIGLAILLVLGGFFILRSVRDTTTFAGGSPPADDTPLLGGGETPADPDNPGTVVTDDVPVETQPQTPAPTRSGAIVQVANNSRVSGAAGTMTTTLTGAGYSMAAATDVNRSIVGEAAFEDSIIYYVEADAAAAAVAQQLATDLAVPAANVQAMPAQIPTTSGTLGTATVLLVLGKNQAGSHVAPLAGAATATPATGGQTLLPQVPAGNTGG